MDIICDMAVGMQGKGEGIDLGNSKEIWFDSEKLDLRKALRPNFKFVDGFRHIFEFFRNQNRTKIKRKRDKQLEINIW